MLTKINIKRTDFFLKTINFSNVRTYNVKKNFCIKQPFCSYINGKGEDLFA